MAWDATLPADDNKIRTTGTVTRENFEAIALGDDVTATYSPTSATMLQQYSVQLLERNSRANTNDPVTEADTLYLYCKQDVAGTAEGYVKDPAGNVIQLTSGGALYSNLVQTVSNSGSSSATATTLFTTTTSIPTNTQGDEFTTLAITPKSSTSTLIIEFFVPYVGVENNGEQFAMALFQDSTANALTATFCQMDSNKFMSSNSLKYIMTSGTTSATTFKVRFGANGGGDAYMNKAAASQFFGAASNWLFTIQEVL